MQATVVMLMALTGLGCHHKNCGPAYATGCYSSCYSGGYSSCYSGGGYSSCYSGGYASMYGGGCYSSMGGYSSCYSGGYSSCYSGGGCYSSCYSGKRHKHGLFGCKRKSCAACCEPAPVYPVACGMPACNTCGSAMPVFGTYTPVYESYASSQYLPSSQGATSYSAPAAAPARIESAPASSSNPTMPDSGTPAPPPPPVPAPAPAPAPPPAAGF